MKFKIDENLPAEFASALRSSDFEADTVGDEGLSGAEDPRVFERCQIDVRILVTLDLDFSNIQAYPPGEHAGIVVIRTRHKPNLSCSHFFSG